MEEEKEVLMFRQEGCLLMQLVSEHHKDYIFIDVFMHVDPISAGASEGATSDNGMFTVTFFVCE